MMRRRWPSLLLAAVLVCAAGCSLFRKKPKPLFPVDLCLHSDPQAQQFRGKPHSLFVRVFPLTMVDAFNAGDVDDLTAKSPPTLLGAAGTPQSRMLPPGASNKVTFNAKEDEAFEFVGIVAGYYELKGSAKMVIKTEELRTETCYTIEFGPSGITGGAPAPTPPKDK